MSCDCLGWALEGVRGLHPYQPGKPVEELERELGITGIIKLASNESPLGPGEAALAAGRQALDDAARYPDGSGFRLKARLAEQLGVTAQQVTLGNGSNDILELVARTWLQPGAECVFAEHAFAVYPLVTRVTGAQAVVVPARDWGHDLEAMADAVTEATRLVFIANPNNPTGTWVGADALRTFLDRVPERVVVVLDEAYFEYVREAGYPDGLELLSRYPNLIVTRTFSKARGLAGLRIGYGLSSPEIADLLNRVRQPFNVNSVALAAAEASLDDAAHLERSVRVNSEGLRQLADGCGRLGLEYIPSVANFLSIDTGRDDAMPVYDGLLRRGVIVRPVANYAMPRHIRVSVGLESENARFLAALEEVLDR